MLFRDWCQSWLDIYKVPFVGKSTLDTIKYCLKHILPAFGNKELSDVRGVDIQAFVNSLNSKPNIQDKCRKYLQDIFEYAYRNRYIDFNPMLAVKFKTYRFKNTKPLNEDEREQFIKSLDGKKYKLLYLTYLYTGARLAEVITPGSFEVDFDRKIIYIHGTKTAGSDRIMPLFDKLAEELKRVPDYKVYFERYTRNYVYLRLKRHLEECGLPHFSVRALRCTFSLMCYELGVRATTVQAWLGHTTVKTTTTFYLDKKSLAQSMSETVQNEVATVNKNL